MSRSFKIVPNVGALPIEYDMTPAEVAEALEDRPSETHVRHGVVWCDRYDALFVYYDEKGCSSIVPSVSEHVFLGDVDLCSLSFERACGYLGGFDEDLRRSRFGECTSLQLGIQLVEDDAGGDTLKHVFLFKRSRFFQEEEIRRIARAYIEDEETLQEIEEFLWAGEDELALDTLVFVLGDDRASLADVDEDSLKSLEGSIQREQ